MKDSWLCYFTEAEITRFIVWTLYQVWVVMESHLNLWTDTGLAKGWKCKMTRQYRLNMAYATMRLFIFHLKSSFNFIFLSTSIKLKRIPQCVSDSFSITTLLSLPFHLFFSPKWKANHYSFCKFLTFIWPYIYLPNNAKAESNCFYFWCRTTRSVAKCFVKK